MPLGWEQVLERLEADALRVAAAAAGDPDQLVEACRASLDVEALDLPPLPEHLAERAVAALRTLADAEAAVSLRVSAVRRDLDGLGTTRTSVPARYFDRGL